MQNGIFSKTTHRTFQFMNRTLSNFIIASADANLILNRETRAVGAVVVG